MRASLFAMSVCVTDIERGGPGYFNVLVMMFRGTASNSSRSSACSRVAVARHALARRSGVFVRVSPYQAMAATRNCPETVTRLLGGGHENFR